MSVKVQYVKNGFVGVASEKAAAIMEKRGEVKILATVKDAPAPESKKSGK